AARLRASALNETALVLDLGSIHEPGEQTFTVTKDTLTLPTGVVLVRAVPSQVRVRLERRASREVPVEIRFSGPPPEGYRVVHQETTPAQIRIVGPESQVEQVTSVQTDPVDLSSKLATSEFRVPFYIPNPQVRTEQQESVVVVRVGLEKVNRGPI
ncbi:MAG TPA: YbbR-like domain-containing protein, partial [Bryobacteraceae bacterium]|nr:YbbR-like domain-containing protein [Bryobacteraceae bacterium]